MTDLPQATEQQQAPQAQDPAAILDHFLKLARRRGASDLHIGSTVPIIVRLHGELFVLHKDRLNPDQARALLAACLTEQQLQQAEEKGGVELLLSRPEGRYRVCIVRQRLGWDGCFHIIPSRVPDAHLLGIPKSVQKLTHYHNGLILVTGPRGSGKTTTVGALLNVVNQERADHVLTIDDPVEYTIPSVRCLVSQRTVGLHTETFASALRAALREDPDIISIGELRDAETISMAVTAAETGHLVIGSMSTGNSVGAVARIMDAFPIDQQSQVRAMLSESLRGVVSQRLVPRADGAGRVLALEILINTPGIGSLIREGRMFQVRSAIQTGKRLGMQTIDDHLNQLIKEGQILPEAALKYAEEPEKILVPKQAKKKPEGDAPPATGEGQ